MFVEAIRILAILAAAVFIGYVTVTVYQRITTNVLRDEVRKECPNALKALIIEKSRNAIDVGIFTESEDEISDKLTIKSEEGVSNKLKKGMIISI